MKPLVKLQNLSMFYQSGSNINVGVSKINLEFFCGEFIAITGESGAGKTTILNIIGAALPYHDGELFYNDLPSSHFDNEDREKFRRDNIGYICQDYNLIDSFTLLENVTAALLIKGVEKKEAEQKALMYLEKVGLKNIANSRASKISSGQKQRLGIARALAKECQIILADEPTGNLDIENGREIVRLLKELSKDHLVIMVTHNFDLVENEVTRLIRINDGVVTFDKKLREDNKKEVEIKEQKTDTVVKISRNLALLNFKAKPKRGILLIVFMLLLSFSTFILTGSIIANLDKWGAMNYDDTAFKNGNDTRIVFERNDGAVLTNEDYIKLNSLKYVEEVDLHDLVNDFNYYDEEGVDYTNTYYADYLYDENQQRIDSSRVDHTIPYFISDKKFLRTSSCLTESMLSEGRLPQKTNEIVACGNKDLLGTTRLVYIKGQNVWNQTTYVSFSMTVVGILNNSSDQIYISDMLAKELSTITVESMNHSFSYRRPIIPDQSIGTKVFIFTDDIPNTDVNLSNEFFDITEEYLSTGYVDETTAAQKDLQITNTSLLVSRNVIIVSNDYFEEYYGSFASTQGSIYIEDYAYTDEALKLITNAGYHAASVKRICSTTFNDDLLIERYVTIGICAAAILVTFGLTLFVLSAFLSLNKKDYLLLRLLGMNRKEMYLTNYFEILSCSVVMYVLSLLLTACLNFFKVSLVHSIIKYMSWYQFIVIFLIVLLIVFTTTRRFNKILENTYSKKGGEING